ncbi:hypothetical protein TNCT_357451, partial [Trichonephila clavata]
MGRDLVDFIANNLFESLGDLKISVKYWNHLTWNKRSRNSFPWHPKCWNRMSKDAQIIILMLIIMADILARAAFSSMKNQWNWDGT